MGTSSSPPPIRPSPAPGAGSSAMPTVSGTIAKPVCAGEKAINTAGPEVSALTAPPAANRPSPAARVPLRPQRSPRAPAGISRAALAVQGEVRAVVERARALMGPGPGPAGSGLGRSAGAGPGPAG
ncbi:hypothetical protein ACODT3_34565 [Streptomyces sp. 4.24]|uniref:hypothetical protein n=1 Tax=Streptomyces tritrimontium TaxID=3406573 RepID=UPI003BB6FE27